MQSYKCFRGQVLHMATTKSDRKKGAQKPPGEQYSSFADVHQEATRLEGDKVSTEELVGSGDEFLVERYFKRRSQYGSETGDYYYAVQIKAFGDQGDQPRYFNTSSPVVGDQLERTEHRMPFKARLEKKRAGSGRDYLTLA